MGDSQLFAATFAVSDIKADKYDRVARVFANTEDGETYMHLDINTDLFSCTVFDRLHIVLASTLSLDGVKDDVKGGRREPRSGDGPSLADEYDYVCHGKIYRFEEKDQEKIKVYASFGGLLLYLEGPFKDLTSLRGDSVYLMVKK